MRDDDPDYPALVLGNYMLGGGFLNSRLATRIRQKEGLSYGVGSGLGRELAGQDRHVPGLRDLRAAERGEARGRVQGGDDARGAEGRLHGRGGRTRRSPGICRRARCSARRTARSPHCSANDLFLGRTLAWDAELEKRVAALTPAEIVAAMRRHIDPSKITIIKAGDFAKKAPPVQP